MPHVVDAEQLVVEGVVDQVEGPSRSGTRAPRHWRYFSAASVAAVSRFSIRVTASGFVGAPWRP